MATLPRHNFWCADCGKRMFRSRHSLPQGSAKCRGCRSQGRPSACADCGGSLAPGSKARCWACYAEHVKSNADPEAARRRKREQRARVRRERAAPGLNTHQRKLLLAKWKRQGKTCAYCPAPAQSVDHVVPLALGGTNYEGNLAPCCTTCNCRKSDMTLVEWRNRTRIKRERLALPPMPAPKPKQYRPKPLPLLIPCRVCGTATPRRLCSDECNVEWHRRVMRDRYRRRVGLPVDHTAPSRVWAPTAMAA